LYQETSGNPAPPSSSTQSRGASTYMKSLGRKNWERCAVSQNTAATFGKIWERKFLDSASSFVANASVLIKLQYSTLHKVKVNYLKKPFQLV
jgi:hypothetical protein